MAKKDEQKPKAEPTPKKEKQAATTEKKGSHKLLSYAAAVIFILAILLLAYIVITPMASSGINASTASFSTFKSNLNSAQRVSILVTYANRTGLDYESQCVNDIIEILSSKRSPSTIDFYETNATSCTFSPGGLGHEVTPQNASAQTCINNATSETGISLLYGPTNMTTVTPYILTVEGNAAYMAKCPIAVDLS